MNIANPKVFSILDPKGIDAKIVEINNSLSTLTYIEKLFGRAYLLSQESQLVPKVYQGSKEYFNVLPNDALKCFSFFEANKPRENELYTDPLDRIDSLSTEISMIVFGNYEKIDRTKGYPFSEEIIIDILRVLATNNGVVVNRVYDTSIEDIYSNYKLLEDQKLLLHYPYFALKFDMDVTYNIKEPC